MKKIRNSLLVLLTLTVMNVTVNAQPIALPSGTVTGKLPNGLSYIIQRNPLPRHTAECRLVMHVGSIQENDNQQGSAHFLEHMCFNGTRNFPGTSMVDYFERQGMKYGRDINAFTGFDRTIYWMTIPVENSQDRIVDTTLMAMNDILHHVTFDSTLTQRERGVILEELRGYDTHDNFYDLKIGKGKYSRHMPLGTSRDISRTDRTLLVDYYHHWYVPSLATVIIVGDIDPGEVEKKLKSRMGQQSRPHPNDFRSWPLDYPDGLSFKEVDDSLNTSSKLELIIPHATTPTGSIEAYVQHSRMNILVRALGHRLAQHGIDATVSDNWYLADKNHFVTSLSEKSKERFLHNITTTSAELRRLAGKGMEPRELTHWKEAEANRQRLAITDKLSAVWVEDWIDYALMDDRLVYQSDESERIKAGIRNTTTADIKALARGLLRDMERSLLVAYTNNGGKENRLTEKEIAWAMKNHKAVKPVSFALPQKPTHVESLLPVPEVLNTDLPYRAEMIKSTTDYDEIGIREIALHNGVRLLLRPTYEGDSTVYLTIWGRGGTADLPDSLYQRYKDTAGYVDMGGIEGLSTDSLSEFMGQQQLSMTIGIDNYWHALLGSSKTEKAPMLLRLMYEKMAHPGVDRQGFRELIDDELENYGKTTVLEEMMVRDTERRIMAVADSLLGAAVGLQYAPMTKSDIRQMNIDSMTTYYKRLFTSTRDLYILVCGQFDKQEMARELVSVFGRLQQHQSPVIRRNEPFALPGKAVTMQFEGGADGTQTSCNFIYPFRYEPSLRSTLKFKLMRDIIQNRMLDVLRSQMNIVYSPYVNALWHGTPQRVAALWLSADVKNENYQHLRQALDRIIADLRTNPISDAELRRLKLSFLVNKRQNLNDVAPAEWRRVVKELIESGEKLSDYDQYDSILRSITPQEIRDEFYNNINPDRLILLYRK